MKKKILIATPFLPRHDQNSGDLRLFSMMRILSTVFEITCLTKKWGEETDDKYINVLSENGINVLIDGEYSLYNILWKNNFSVALLEFFTVAEKYLPKIRIMQPDCKIIIDTVDVHYYRAYSKYVLTGKEEDLHEAENTKWRELSIYEKADLVVAVTDEDAKILKKDSPIIKTRIIPNIHELQLSNNEPLKNTLIFIGGFIHSPNIDAALYLCNSILPIIRKKIPDIKLSIVGSKPTDEIKALSNNNIHVTGFVASTTPYLHNHYISVAPLRYGAGMKGKVGEAMAHGRPVVTTSVGAQGMNMRNGENILIADDPERFANAIISLIEDENLYRKIQSNAIEHIKKYYTVDIVERIVLSNISELMESRAIRMSLNDKIASMYHIARNGIKKRMKNQ